MNIYRYTAGVIVGVLLAVTAFMVGQAEASFTQVKVQTHHVRCIETIRHGDAYINDCRVIHHHFRNVNQPFWTQRNCTNADDMNCFARDPGDGGTHPHFRREWGGLLCVYFSGSRRYANGHDYCVQS